MYSSDGEFIQWFTSVVTEGAVERWLSAVEAEMRATLKRRLDKCHASLKSVRLARWVDDHAGQLLIVARQIQWTNDCQKALTEVEKGSKTAMRRLIKKQKVRNFTQHGLNNM